MNLKIMIPDDWRVLLSEEFDKPYFAKLENFVAEEYRTEQIFPAKEDMFNAFHFSPVKKTSVMILGQDPYHDDGQAHGLCFSVKKGMKLPPSLCNIFKELREDLGTKSPNHGCLDAWAKQGVLMLNTVLTVRAHQANSHKKQGWETFTDAVIRVLNKQEKPIAFILWGGPAQKKRSLIDEERHSVHTSAHPSPLSAYRGFFGSRPFSSVNEVLKKHGKKPINWGLTPVQPSLFN